MIDIRVETFLCVCKNMNYTRAAEELGMTQPAVSQHIRCLEEFYNTKLFHYYNKKLELTAQGIYLKKNLETIFHDIRYMRETVQNIKQKRKIKIGATLSIGEFYIPAMLSEFMKKTTETELSVTIADTRELLYRLDSGDVDFILCEGYFDKNQYAYDLIEKDEMCIVCSAEYDCGDIHDLKSLFKHHMLIREMGSGTREIFENYLRENNYSLDNFTRISEFSSPHLIKKLLLDNHGISVLYRTVVKDELYTKRLVEITIPEFNIVHEFNAVWKRCSVFEDEYKEILEQLFGFSLKSAKVMIRN